MWLNDIEGGALVQARNLANLPFAFKHIALLPDCHQGYGMPMKGIINRFESDYAVVEWDVRQMKDIP